MALERPTNMPILDIARLTDEFCNHGKYLRSWSKKTVQTYRHGLGLFQEFVQREQLPLTKSALQRWVIWLREERKLTPGGCNTHIRSVNSFLSWLHEEGYTAEALHMALLPKPRLVPRLLTRLEIWKLLGRRPTDLSKLRTWALIGMLVDTGVRIEEALLMRSAEVDMDALKVRVTGKGGHQREVPISPEGRKILFRWLVERERRELGGPFVFAAGDGNHLSYRNAYRDIKLFAAQRGVQGVHVHPHAFRHYFAVGFLQNGGDLFTLSRILGHTTVSTTQIYLKSMGIEQIGEVHLRASPLQQLARGKPREGDGKD